MYSYEKLRLLQLLSGTTQAQLAQKLGVTILTLHHWLHGKSQPRKAAIKRIDQLLHSYTHIDEELPTEPVKAKQKILLRKSQTSKNVIKTIASYPDVHDSLILTLTYTSNRIEGSTLTEQQTAVVLFQNATLRNKTLTEQLEAKNHQAALSYLFRWAQEHSLDELSENLILRFHGILMNGIRDDAGFYRRHGVRIVGAEISTANHLKIPDLMRILVADIPRKTTGWMQHCASIHSRFEKIHPFSDGNGRVGRLLLHAMLLSQNFAPAVIHPKNKRRYYQTLNTAQKSGDTDGLEEFLMDAVLAGFRLLEL